MFKEQTPSWQDVKEYFGRQLGFYNQVEITEEENAQLYELYNQAVAHKDGKVETMYKSMNQLSNAALALINKKAKLGWTSHDHTAHAVPVFAIGVGAERFTGWHDNTEIAPLILKAAQ